MIFYFSGTGNSQWMAEQLSKSLQDNLVFIPDALKSGEYTFSLRDDEKIGFLFPIYSWAPPEIVLSFVRQLMLKGWRDQYLYFVCSCGDDIGLAQKVFEKAVAVKGWKCSAGFSVAMPNTYVLLPGFDVDHKDLEKKKLEAAVSTLKGVTQSIKSGEKLFVCNKGRFPFMKTKVISPLFNKYQMSPRKFHVTEFCVGCKRCEKSCPVGNVSIVNGKPIWGMDCTACLACYHVCPQQAVQYGKRTKNKGQYFNPNV